MADEVTFVIWEAGVPRGPLSISELVYGIASGQIRASTTLAIAHDDSRFPAGLLPLFPSLTPNYHDWLWCIKRNPRNADPKATALLLAAIPLIFIAVLFGLAVFPPGSYPRIVLAAPGLVAAGVLLYPFGYLVFKVSKVLGILLSLLAALLGGYVLFRILGRLLQ